MNLLIAVAKESLSKSIIPTPISTRDMSFTYVYIHISLSLRVSLYASLSTRLSLRVSLYAYLCSNIYYYYYFDAAGRGLYLFNEWSLVVREGEQSQHNTAIPPSSSSSLPSQTNPLFASAEISTSTTNHAQNQQVSIDVLLNYWLSVRTWFQSVIFGILQKNRYMHSQKLFITAILD